MEFLDRILKCSDCANEFIFTAGEQLFFFDRQFKNDPKRCKLCKAKRAGFGRTAEGAPVLAELPLSRTETRTKCSSCNVETTVPFKPTQGRPVFCRSCFQTKRAPAIGGTTAGLDGLAVSPVDGAGTASVGLQSSSISVELLALHAGEENSRTMAVATLSAIADGPAAAFGLGESVTTGLDLV